MTYCGSLEFQQALQIRYSNDATAYAVGDLAESDPINSAAQLFSKRQIFFLSISAIAIISLLITFPVPIIIAFNIIVTSYFLIAIVFRLFLASRPLKDSKAGPLPGDASPLYNEHNEEDCLPVVSILLPLFREASSLPSLFAAISKLDYPPEKMDVKLIIEEEDEATIAAAESLHLFEKWDVVTVPPSHPQTKPKACNYALAFAKGELTVIYDAEDEPEPDQLRKAAAVFASDDDNLICVQARLNFYNAHENWLTRLFALEYALWFDNLLPALIDLGAPIPLGGTSNFFRTQKLMEIGAWDPFNVTEDADLGLRIARKGYTVKIIDSTTFEEANCRLINWIRQRSRWMKGYLQTWIVDLRQPARGRDGSRAKGLASSQMFIAATAISALINPVLWGLFFYWLLTKSTYIGLIFPEPLLSFNLFALLFGNALFIYLAMTAPVRRGWHELSPWALLAPFYLWLASLAAYIGLWQLVTRPSYWEKTDHGISRIAKQKAEWLLANPDERQR
ncbi:MAG: glycosyltransferase family 2 protein [Pseudomonadota bacterium]